MTASSGQSRAVLVTGGAGFIGCALAPQLLELGLPVVAVDNLLEQVHPGRARPAALPEQVGLVEGDVADPHVWDELLSRVRPELVVHLAAETGTAQSLTESTRHATTNVVGTTTMLDALVRHDAFPNHVVLTSTRAVYGEGPWRAADGSVFSPPPRSHAQLEAAEWDHLDPSGQPATPLATEAATAPYNPSSVYGSTKLAQELVLRNWSASFGIPLSVFRPQNVYGPGQSPHNPYTGIITLFHRLASRGETLDVYEDGEINRDFVYIDDVVSALAAAVAAPPDAQRVLDIGSGVRTTIHDAARMIAEHHGAPEPKVSGRFRDGDVRSAWADVTATREALGWEPTWSFRDGSAAVSDWLERGGFLG
ncbi:NAD-dependent epimerase/dehydratase family protein [Nocardioides anomalus]|uniref:NAD-dependent epimerase/dehydratase family protein n=1 Tax=Nocardioides anomalus TaxID=2712223 RepID=A0A6G6WLU1_9ACTN|nr:NAD-dependent epimerase/dehydratase family protein [Nocardioides anomalus]